LAPLIPSFVNQGICARQLDAMTDDNTALTHLQFGVAASDIAAVVHCHSLFANADLAALTKLVGRGRLVTLRPGELLACQGEASDAAYFVIEGSASIRIETSYGRGEPVDRISAGSCR
jgi:hypothetical protein